MLWLSSLLISMPVLAALQLSGVSSSPASIAIPAPTGFEIQFHVNDTAQVNLDIYDARGWLVRQISSGKAFTPGDHSLRWDGKDAKGQWVPAEVYTYALTATDANGTVVVHDLTDQTGGEFVEPQDITYDPEAGVVRYWLPHSARVMMRYGVEKGPMLGTLVNAGVRTAGKQEEPWSGWDASNVILLKNHPRLTFYGRSYRLPRNALVVTRDEPVDQMQPAWLDLKTGGTQRQHQARPRGLDSHSYHAPDQCRDFTIQLKMLGEHVQQADGTVTVSGPTAFRVELAPDDAMMVEAQRFEASYYLDNVLVHENEVSYSPYTWVWSPGDLGEGVHYMTVMIIGYGSHVGTGTLRFTVEEQPADSPPEETS